MHPSGRSRWSHEHIWCQNSNRNNKKYLKWNNPTNEINSIKASYFEKGLNKCRLCSKSMKEHQLKIAKQTLRHTTRWHCTLNTAWSYRIFKKNSLCLWDFASLHQLIFVSSMHQKRINVHHALRVSVHVNILSGLFLDQCFQCPSARPISWFIHIQNSVPCYPWRESDVACFHCRETKGGGGNEDTSTNQSFSYQLQLFWYSNSFLIAWISLFRNSPREETNMTTPSTVNLQL